MIEETLHAANWWVEKILSYNINVESPSWQSHFEKVMTELLRAKYHSHWYSNEPSRGSGYRAISNEYSLDPILDKAAKAVSHSLPHNLARMVLTSDDRWLVMFVNPGEVIVRDKKFQEIAVYDEKKHIYNKSLRKKSSSTTKWLKTSSKHSSKLKPSAAEPYSKSDDETLSTLDETKSDLDDAVPGNAVAKSDGEDVEAMRQLWLTKIHNAAAANKEKELIAHVEMYREELAQTHNAMWKSPSKSSLSHSHSAHTTNTNSTATTTTSSSDAHSAKASPNKPNGVLDVAALVVGEKANSPLPASSPLQRIKLQQAQLVHHLHVNGNGNGNGNNNEESHNNTNLKTNHHQIFPKLQNGGLHHHHLHSVFNIDANHSNYGKHLKQILNSCQIHNRLKEPPSQSPQHHRHKNGTSLSSPPPQQTAYHGSEHLHDDGDDYLIQMNGEYPMLFPLSYASPSPTISPSMGSSQEQELYLLNENQDDVDLHHIDESNITPLHGPIIDSLHATHRTDIDGSTLDKQPHLLKPSKSQPTSKNAKCGLGAFRNAKRMKSTGNLIDFQLHIHESSDEDVEDNHYSKKQLRDDDEDEDVEEDDDVAAHHNHHYEEDQNSEIVINNASSPIYGNSKVSKSSLSSSR